MFRYARKELEWFAGNVSIQRRKADELKRLARQRGAFSKRTAATCASSISVDRGRIKRGVNRGLEGPSEAKSRGSLVNRGEPLARMVRPSYTDIMDRVDERAAIFAGSFAHKNISSLRGNFSRNFARCHGNCRRRIAVRSQLLSTFCRIPACCFFIYFFRSVYSSYFHEINISRPIYFLLLLLALDTITLRIHYVRALI